MAFIPANLAMSYQGGAGNLKRWSFITIDSAATVVASGYFTAAEMQTGDLVDVVMTNSLVPAARTLIQTLSLVVTAT